MPKHIWSKVADPATFTNPNPVGSGPFAKVGRFTSQDYVFNKNPNYWMAGAPKIPCLEYTQAASNDSALLAIQSGQVDWTHNFVPNVAKAYSAKDQAHYHSFYATTAYAQSLVFDTTQYPYSIVAFRKALSLAINRSDVSKLGEYGYAPPTDALGINYIFPKWDKGAVHATAQAAAAYNPTAAKKLLTDAGFTYKGSTLLDPKGNPVKLDIHVISGWSDWVASDQIISKNLQAIGIDSNVALEPDWNSWYPNASSTKNPTLLWQTASQASPYAYFLSNLSQLKFTPSGQDATNTGNWAHIADAQATASAQPVEGDPQPGEAAVVVREGLEHLPADPADHPAVRRAALVDVQHEVLPLLLVAEGLLRRSDLHDSARQHPLLHADLPGRQGRRVNLR